MVTLAFAQMAYYVVHDTPLGGGTDGIYLNVKPALGKLLELDQPIAFYQFTLAMLVLVFGFLALLLRSRSAGTGRHPRQRATHAGHRLFDLPLQAGGLHHVRRHRRRWPASCSR